MSIAAPARCGFAPIEALVALALGAALAGLLLPAVQNARATAARASCANNMKQIGAAVLGFERAHHKLPKNMADPYYGDPTRYGLGVALLPHIGRSELDKRYDHTVDYRHPDNAAVVSTPIGVYQCPAAPGERVVTARGFKGATTDYTSARGVRVFTNNPNCPESIGALEPSIFGGGSGVVQPALSLISDGLSTTLMIEERAGLPANWVRGKKVADAGTNSQPFGSWAHPWGGWVGAFDAAGNHTLTATGTCSVNCANFGDTNQNTVGIYSFHAGGCNFTFMDGSVRFIRESVSPAVVAALVSRQGGELVNEGDF